jgi:dethiobiotin synthetase
MQGKTIFISGIDTDVGKTLITGTLAKKCMENNINAITQKITQTGVEGIAEDILTHRRIMGVDLYEYDKSGITCPYVFKTPASPHLAAKLEDENIDTKKIKRATELLERKFELVFLEGAGGLHVPLNDSVNIIDYIQDNNYPLILVSTSKLGSINHTLLSLEIIKQRNVNLLGMVYNEYPGDNKEIQKDSILIFRRFMKEWFSDIPIVRFPVLENVNNPFLGEMDTLINNIKEYLYRSK